MDETPDNFLAIGVQAAIEAGKEALKVQQSLKFETLFKSDGSPATEGDKNAERKIIQIISQAFPTHKLIGEEFGVTNKEATSDYTWVFDPIVIWGPNLDS